eukprot:s2929_g3.t1
MLRVQPWRAFIFGDNAWLSLACRCFSTDLLPGKRAKLCWQISSHGRCCNLRGVVSAGTLCPSGYRAVQISGKQFYVHRLVAFAFLGPPSDQHKWQVHHRDGNPSNNHLENLEYTTPRQNVLHSYASASRRTCGHSLSKPVMWRVVGSQDWRTSASMVSAARDTGVPCASVRSSCQKQKSVKGFEFCHYECVEDEKMAGEEWKQMLDPCTRSEISDRMVSSLGRVKFQNGRISAGYQRKKGYCVIGLNCRTQLVHRLVAAAFLGPPPTLQHVHVNHKDHDKGNNAVENLEYTTASENVHHSYTNSARRRPTSNRMPIESRLSGSDDVWTWHTSTSSAAEACRVSRSTVSSRACYGCSSRAKFEFRFAEDPSTQTRPGEEWRDIDVAAHLNERMRRMLQTGNCHDTWPCKSHLIP